MLFLDEPTAGLDVASRVALHDLMRERQEAGTTIILATHDMAEAEEMADRIAILLRGKIVATALAKSVLPDPGGPNIKTLWPPAAATSKALFTCSCPFTSEKSTS